MTQVLTLEKDDIGVWKLAGRAYPEKQLEAKFADFLALSPRPKFEDEEVYFLPTKDMPESVIDALFLLRREGHGMYMPAHQGQEEGFQIDRPIYELIMELLLGLLGKIVDLARGGRSSPPTIQGTGRPRKGQPRIAYEPGF